MKRSRRTRHWRRLQILGLIAGAVIGLLWSVRVVHQLGSLRDRIGAEKAYLATAPRLDHRRLEELRSMAETKDATETGSAAGLPQVALITIGERLRSTARRIPIDLEAYGYNEQESLLSLTCEGEAGSIIAYLGELHTSRLPLRISRLTLARTSGENRLRLYLELQGAEEGDESAPLRPAAVERITTLLDYVPPKRAPGFENPSKRRAKGEEEEADESTALDTLPFSFVGEAVIDGVDTLFFKDHSSGRVVIVPSGEYRLSRVEEESVILIYKERIYRVAKN